MRRTWKGLLQCMVVADAGYSNGEQVAHCEAARTMPYVRGMRTVNRSDGLESWAVALEPQATTEIRSKHNSHSVFRKVINASLSSGLNSLKRLAGSRASPS